MALAVRQQEKLVAAVKVDERTGRFRSRQSALPAMVREHSFDKVFPRQSTFFFDRQKW
jgi:hypothetical protein